MDQLGTTSLLALFAIGFSVAFVFFMWGYSLLLNRAADSVMNRQPRETDEMHRFIQARVDTILKSAMFSVIVIVPFTYDYLPNAKTEISICLYMLPLVLLVGERLLKWYFLKRMLAC